MYTTVILGSGHVATHLAKQFQQTGNQILQVYSRTAANAKALAATLECSYTTDLNNVNTEAELYLIAVSDQAIPAVVQALPATLNGLVVHCSGATDIEILRKFNNYGVFYPPQSISKDVEIDFRSIPLCIEANSPSNGQALLQLAQHLSPTAFYCNSEQRLAIHLASVWSNNFSNILYQIAYELLEEHNLSFDIIRPIILQTAEKVQHHIPIDVQTGPALRTDLTTIKKHLDFISDKPDLQKIYQLLSQQITKRK